MNLRPAPALPLLVALATLAVARGPSAAADTVLLKDGRTVENVKVEKAEGKYKISFKNGDVFLAEAVVKDVLIEGAAGFEPKNDEERALAAKGLVPYEGRWVARAERDGLLAKKTAAAKKRIDDAKAHRLWRNRYKEKTANFDFEYTIPPDIAKGYMDLMETYYAFFTKAFDCRRNPKQKLKVCFYHDYDSFVEVSGAPRGVVAYYRFVEPRELNFFYDRLRPQETVAIMFHEAQHYLAHLLDLGFSYPHCFGESMAEYFGGSTWDPAKKQMVTGGVQEGRLTEVMTDIQAGEKKSLSDLLENKLGYEDYTWGWTFCHFMMETPRYAGPFRKFYIALSRGKDVVRADDGRFKTVEGAQIKASFQKYLGVNDLTSLENEWMEYVKGKLKLESVVGYEEAALAAMRTDQPIRAERFFKLAVEKGSTNPSVYLRYGELRERKGTASEAIALYRKGLEFDPLNTDLYTRLGRAVRGEKGDENDKEGRRLLELAREIDPDNADISMLIEDAMEKLAGDGGDAPK